MKHRILRMVEYTVVLALLISFAGEALLCRRVLEKLEQNAVTEYNGPCTGFQIQEGIPLKFGHSAKTCVFQLEGGVELRLPAGVVGSSNTMEHIQTALQGSCQFSYVSSSGLVREANYLVRLNSQGQDLISTQDSREYHQNGLRLFRPLWILCAVLLAVMAVSNLLASIFRRLRTTTGYRKKRDRIRKLLYDHRHR